ncbi:MAG: hypothetical protein A3J46_00830 [Candidatus Yanofskybacteria bacterium RIFCSPHIGHO2_02_FULL_41_11]|uniref:Uncharacterized protein n=1 Tax=Candidatus Yanofskybacteria bacterium RIFCSPHIGHO2_02_FULL_41_11 TaxID=1802675 RepID=A0A1F8F4V8_9BACT|nr:MAG: hypothetical protein A3J46_00830 [Candidatus Yanofskybacteria bacterium RIFCSPHIGHO2_02_FULL_41_11]
MLQNLKTNGWFLLFAFIATLVIQFPSALVFYKVSEMHNAILHYQNDIFVSGIADNSDIEFINQLRREWGLGQDIKILVGPYKKVYGDNFRYRLERRLVLIEQPLSAEELFYVLFDKTFYREIGQEEHKGVLAHEMYHILSLAKEKTKHDMNEEIEADNFAVKYVAADVLISLCQKYEGNEIRKNERIKNLEKQGVAS